MRRLVGALLTVGLMAVGLITAPAASAATFTVTNLNDSGAGSLRQALNEAVAAGGADRIDVLTTGQINLTSGSLVYSGGDNLTISGNNVIVNASAIPVASPNGRVMDFRGASGLVSISNMTISGGTSRTVLTSDPCNNFVPGQGGGIATAGPLSLTNVIVTGNRASKASLTYTPCPTLANPTPTPVNTTIGGFGGGVFTVGILTIQSSQITNNVADVYGGGVYAVEQFSAVGSVFSGNSAGESGGGVFNPSRSTFVRSTLAGNTAGFSGGGLLSACDINLAESTVTGNTAGSFGGGVTGSGGEIRNTTITGNTTSGSGGGGIDLVLVGFPNPAVCPSRGIMAVNFSTIARNTSTGGGSNLEGDAGINWTFVGTVVADPLGTGANCAVIGSVTATYSYSWGTGAPGCLFSGPTNVTSTLAGDNPGLGALASNGGPTQTMLPGVPLRGKIPAVACTVDRDQRSKVRPFDNVCDIGAVEYVEVQTPSVGVNPDGTCREFNAINPVRVLDTRSDTSRAVDGSGAAATPGRVGQGQIRGVNVTNVPGSGDGGVPSAGVEAVVLNVTATDANAPSFITVWPNGDTRPNASSLNTEVGTDVPNATIARVGSNGLVNLFNNAGNVHLIVDVVGWFAECGRFTSIVPTRALDTRSGTGAPAGLVGAGGSISVRVLNIPGTGGTPGVPALNVKAVVLNVTATESTSPSFITVWPSGETRPVASSLNTEPGQDVPNLVIAKVGGDGQINLFNNAGNTHLVADILGYFSFDSSFQPLTPGRVLDTRSNLGATGPVGQQQTRDLTVTGGVVPTNAAAVVINVTATESTAPSFVTVWPTGAGRPVASSLNTEPGVDVPNLVIAKIGTNGRISLFNNAGNVQLVGDIVGYFETTP